MSRTQLQEMVHKLAMVLFISLLVTISFSFWVSFALDSYVQPDWSHNNGCQTWSWNYLKENETIDIGHGYLAKLILKAQGSPSFGFGFVCISTSDSCVLGVLILGELNTRAASQERGPPGLVWVANRDNPISKGGVLKLMSYGEIQLRDSEDKMVWSAGTTSGSNVSITLQQNGNLKLVGENSTMIWRSFDHPTDTLLPGQPLYEAHDLVASASSTNWSSGEYSAKMTPTGFVAFVRADAQLMYLHLTLSQGLSGESRNRTYLTRGCSYNHACRSVDLTSDRNKTEELLNNGSSSRQNTSGYGGSAATHAILSHGNLFLTGTETTITFPVSTATGSYQYLRLDFDGHLRVYEWQRGEVYDFVVQAGIDDCQFPRVCGDYEVCSDGPKCSCPQALDGSEYFRRQSPKRGCTEINPLSCQNSSARHHQLVDFGNLSYFNFIDSHAAIPELKDLKGCRQACSKNCTCRAAFFKYGKNSSDHGHCYLLSNIFSIRRSPIANNENSSAFIKVQLSTPASSIKKKARLGALISVFVAMIFFLLICVAIWRKKKKKKERGDEGEEYFQQMLGFPKRFSYEDVRVATGDFKEKLGEGGFGSVFKGTLEDATDVAVKRLDNRGQGMKEFLAEVKTIGSIHHFNLVRLIGFCAEKSRRFVVYEYMSNGSLDHWIFSGRRRVLHWETRKKIILDIAKGLSYLHEDCRQRIAHLDIKPQNILLDENFNAKVSDFGLSRSIGRDESQVCTGMRGTPGYLAPEWQQLRITLKVDVYSFGVVLLEIICGRKNLDRSRSEPSMHLLRLLQEKAAENRLIDIVEWWTMDDLQVHAEEVLEMIRLAAWCLQDDHTRRPLMSTVVKVLEGAMAVEPKISYSFCNAVARPPTGSAPQVFSFFSDPPQPSVLSGPR